MTEQRLRGVVEIIKVRMDRTLWKTMIANVLKRHVMKKKENGSREILMNSERRVR